MTIKQKKRRHNKPTPTQFEHELIVRPTGVPTEETGHFDIRVMGVDERLRRCDVIQRRDFDSETWKNQ